MNEFKYFIDAVPNSVFRCINGIWGFTWEDDTLVDIEFNDLQNKFKDCISNYVDYIFRFSKEDRTVIAEKTIKELIFACEKAEYHRTVLEKNTSENLTNERIKLEMIFHNGIKNLIFCLFDLKIKYSDEFMTWLDERSKNTYCFEETEFGECIKHEINRFWIRTILDPLNSRMKRKARSKVPKVISRELASEDAKALFQKAIEAKLCDKDGGLYKWNGTKALFAYFVDKTSDYLNVRPSNDRIPWKIFTQAFQCEKDLDVLKQAVNGYKNNYQSEPEGFQDIKNLFK